MKRAEDFRSFMSSLRPLEESVDFLPPLGDLDLEFVSRVSESFPIAEGLYDKSELRGGLKIWDSAYLPAPKSLSFELRRSREMSPLRSINLEWEDTKERLSHIGRPDGERYVRPKGDNILDLMNDDIRILQGAHILTHRMEPILGAIQEDDWTYGQFADVFMRNLIRLFIARKYGLKVNVHPEVDNPEDDSFARYGIEVFGTSELRGPVLISGTSLEYDRARRNPARLIRDKTVVGVLGAVGIEAHPSGAVKPEEERKWREINKWSCLPTLVALVGWEGVDFLTHSEKTEVGEETYSATLCADLQEMKSFPEVISYMKEQRGEVEESNQVFLIEHWLESDDFKKGLSYTPQLPCPMCLRTNSKTPGGVHRPRSQKPWGDLKDAKKYNLEKLPDLKAWVSYAEFMKACIEIGRTATGYASGSITKMKARNAAYAKRRKLLAKIARMEERKAKKAENGYLTEAEDMNKEIELLKEQLDN